MPLTVMRNRRHSSQSGGRPSQSWPNFADSLPCDAQVVDQSHLDLKSLHYTLQINHSSVAFERKSLIVQLRWCSSAIRAVARAACAQRW